MPAPKNKPAAKAPVLHRVSLGFAKKLDGMTAQAVSDAVEDLAAAVFLHNKEAEDGDNWTVTLTTRGAPDKDAILARVKTVVRGKAMVRAEKMPQKDWLRHVHDNFPPVKTKRFFVHGSHFKKSPPKGLIPLQIDAATAFGSGEHETTKGCLMALEWLAKEKRAFKNVLDMGCGSGILAIGAKKLWDKAKITAIDIDPECIVVSKRHAKMNGVKLSAAAGDGYRTKLCKEGAPYDLICANILAGPLVDMAPLLQKALKKDGICVLSGLLARQEELVSFAHVKQGLKHMKTIPVGNWRTLVFRK
jgi:ribosomal protein L11 methyltransferase